MDGARSILIVGGGTAGWLTAAYLARYLDLNNRRDLTITLVESPDIGIVGVGEGSFPTIRSTLQFLGIDEYHFVRETAATFKQGIRFDDWAHAPTETARSQFVHPFEAPLYIHDASLVAMWLAEDRRARPPFAEAVTIQHRVAQAQCAPKQFDERAFSAPLNYAYHFDAAGLARILAERAVSLGVVHIEDRLVAAARADDGSIAHLDFERAGRMTADLFVDCSGLRATLIGEVLGEPFVSARPYLFSDRALTCRMAQPEDGAPLPSYTISTAQPAGWTWDIGLRHARGIGWVFSSAHMSEDEARTGLARYLNAPAVAEQARLIRFEPGYRRRQWVGNCVAVGMAAGFLEPLESTGIVLIEVAAAMIAELLPTGGQIDAAAPRFNALMTARYDSIVNFLKLHYCLSRREEPFWRDNIDPATVPPALLSLLDQWRYRPPSRFDFTLDIETFAAFNYQYILYGMGFDGAAPAAGVAASRGEGAAAFARIRSFAEQAVRDLPSHRELVEQINREG